MSDRFVFRVNHKRRNKIAGSYSVKIAIYEEAFLKPDACDENLLFKPNPISEVRVDTGAKLANENCVQSLQCIA
jgi:hypothetical protein